MTANIKRRIGGSGGDLRGFRSQTWRVRREPRRDCRGTENRQGCVEACNCLRNGEKRQDPEGVNPRGLALTKGCRALPPGDAWSTSRSSSLCTFPEHRRPRAWLRVTVLRFRRRAGFPEFTRFFNHDSSWKLQLGVNPVIATFTHKFTFLQPPALPIELPRSVPRYCSKSRGKYQ